MFILNKENSVANHYLAELREVDIQKDRMRFRRNLERIGSLLAYELSKQLYYFSKDIETPLEQTTISLISDYPVIISILRAGLPFHNGFLEMFDHADSGFIGAFREPHEGANEVEIRLSYQATPPLKGKTVVLVDPMLATGKSLVKAIHALDPNNEIEKLIICSAIGTPEGLQELNVSLNNRNYEVFLGALDERLNEKAYIVPGLGDAGDLSFGEKIRT